MPSWKKLITSGSDAALSSLFARGAVTASIVSASSGFTGSLLGTATSASFVNPLSQSVIITGSLTIGSSSVGVGENTLVVGPAPNGGTGEGGQILLSAVGDTYTTASMIDNYQNKFRVLRGTNAGSDAYKMQIDMHTGQVQIPNYTSPSSFTGTVAAYLAVDSSGNVLTTSSAAGGGGGVTINNNTDNYLITATGALNTLNGEANLQFDGTKLTITGNATISTSLTASIVSASTGITGSLFGTALSASYVTGSIFTGSNLARSASFAVTASHALNTLPSGNQWNIQVNSGSGQFYGDNGFSYTATTRKLTYVANKNFGSSTFDQDAASSIQLSNINDSIFSKTHFANLVHRGRLLTKNSVTSIITFDANNSANTVLKVYGFKCDYSIGYGNQANGQPDVSDSRVGTIYAAWSWDQSGNNISDNHVISDLNGTLKDGIFQLTWASNTIALEYDSGANIVEDCVFNGLFTVFTNK